jgi:site-specific recombinase XerD
MRKTGGGWNKGLIVGKKRPFSKDQVAMIRLALAARGDVMGLAIFETSLSVMLRASDFLALRVGDVVSMGAIVETFDVKQHKVLRGVRCHLSERAREALQAHLGLPRPSDSPIQPERLLWLAKGRKLSRWKYVGIVKGFAELAHADPDKYATHTMRRTLPAHVYRETHDIEAARQLLGHSSVASTSSYLDVSREQAIEVKRKHEL